MTIGYWGNIIITLAFLLSCFFVFKKAINYAVRIKNIAITMLWCFLWVFLFAFELPWLPLIVVRSSYCAMSIIIIWQLTKIKLDTVISAFLLSYGISYFFRIVAVLLMGFVFLPGLGVGFDPSSFIDYNEPIYLLIATLIVALQFLLAFLLFRIRRFRRGFPFIFEKFMVIVALIVAGITLILVSRITTPRESYENTYIILLLAAGILIVGAGIYIWIWRGIKLWQRKRISKHNDDILRKENDRLTRENQQLHEINEKVRVANHSLNHRLASAERNIVRVLDKWRQAAVHAELSEELGVAIADIRKLSGEYNADISRIKVNQALPLTNVREVDDLFALFAERFADSEIEFMLVVKSGISYLIESVIEQGKLETLIGDHLQDALIAVKASDSTFRSVRATIGKVEDFYEFTVHDSGIPFEVDTLDRLGTDRVTTYGDKGGSGVGFMKTFETMRECSASLIIGENKGGVFSKSITIRFDGLNRYNINTYRPGEFPPSDRYSVIGQ